MNRWFQLTLLLGSLAGLILAMLICAVNVNLGMGLVCLLVGGLYLTEGRNPDRMIRIPAILAAALIGLAGVAIATGIGKTILGDKLLFGLLTGLFEACLLLILLRQRQLFALALILAYLIFPWTNFVSLVVLGVWGVQVVVRIKTSVTNRVLIMAPVLVLAFVLLAPTLAPANVSMPVLGVSLAMSILGLMRYLRSWMSANLVEIPAG